MIRQRDTQMFVYCIQIHKDVDCKKTVKQTDLKDKQTTF